MRVIDFMPPRGEARHGPDRRGSRAAACGCAWSWRSASTTAASSPGCAASTDAPRRRRRPGRALPAHARCDPRRGPAHGLRARGGRGRARPLRPHVVALARPPPPAIDPEAALSETESYWREWSEGCAAALPAGGPTVLRRSLIVLKALTYEPTGGIVAAPTTSLPEWIGGVRNWDYRYCWLRDATFTLLALLTAATPTRRPRGATGCSAPSRATPPTCRSCTASPASGGCPEYELPWLAGYEGSRPVRVGNAASEQLQLDVYGEVMDALYQARTHGPRGRHAGVADPACAARAPRGRLAASPTRGSGRSAASAATSSTRR